MALTDITDTSSYLGRHTGPDSAEEQVMLERVGYASLDELVDAALPADIRSTELPQVGGSLTETDAQARLREYAGQNVVLKAFYGQGFSDTITPPVIRRGVVEDPGWYTAYTPYQPEISQGRLEALLAFQTMVSELTGLPVANASLLDEASAVAEAVGLMSRARKKGRRVVLDARLHPQVLAVAAERARAIDLEVEVTDLSAGLVGEDLCGVVLAYPATDGRSPTRRRSSPRSTSGAGWPPWPPIRCRCCCWSRPASWARTSPWAAPSVSACRCSTAVRTRRTWPSPTP